MGDLMAHSRSAPGGFAEALNGVPDLPQVLNDDDTFVPLNLIRIRARVGSIQRSGVRIVFFPLAGNVPTTRGRKMTKVKARF